MLGRCSIGWTVGEQILFDKSEPVRRETCFAETESCLLGINKLKLASIQKELLDTGNSKDYFVFESLLKGNFLLKQ